MGHARSGHTMFKWGLCNSESFDCGHESQTTSHVVNKYPLRAFTGTIHHIHQVIEETVKWIEDLDVTL